MKQHEIRRRRADRAGAEETLLGARTLLYAWDWSHDGQRFLACSSKSTGQPRSPWSSTGRRRWLARVVARRAKRLPGDDGSFGLPHRSS